jgi:hypothetical protein
MFVIVEKHRRIVTLVVDHILVDRGSEIIDILEKK